MTLQGKRIAYCKALVGADLTGQNRGGPGGDGKAFAQITLRRLFLIVKNITLRSDLWLTVIIEGIRWRSEGDSNPQYITCKIRALKSPVLFIKHEAFNYFIIQCITG